MQFTTCAVIISPLTFLWLENLESAFPGFSDAAKSKPKAEKGDARASDDKRTDKKKPQLNVRNTVIKVVIDQTIGAAWNTVLFLTTMGILRGQDYDTVLEAIRKVSGEFRVFSIGSKCTGERASYLCMKETTGPLQ